MARRLPPGPALARGPRITVTVDGRPVTAYAGESAAAVLIAEGLDATRRTVDGSPRGVFCGMGVCFDCLVVLDGVPNTRACLAWVTEGTDIRRQAGLSGVPPAS